jgi:hypothetical protein
LVDSIGIGVESNYVTVKNVRAQYTGGDCFDTCWGKNIVFDNVEGSYAMDQGISSHSAWVTVKNSWFHHNAGCGIVDVNMPKGVCRTKYINCLIEDNPFRGGVEFHSGEYEMESCVIRNGGLGVCKGAKVKIKNCLLIGAENPAKPNRGIGVDSSSGLEMENCTIYRYNKGLIQGVWTTGCNIKASKCAFIDCMFAYWFGTPKDSSVKAEFSSGFNYFAPAYFGINRKKVDFAKYKELKGQDTNSVAAEKYEGALPPCQPITIDSSQKAGADIDLNKVGINFKLMELSK